MIVTRIWRSQPGKYFCLCTKSAGNKWREHFFTRSEFKSVQSFIEDNKDKDVYFCPHGFTKPQRLKALAATPRLLWADLDEADPRTAAIKPTIAIESSPGRFAGIWLVDDVISEDTNRRLTYFLDADKSGWDLTQVLRVPGTINYKYNSTPRVRILWADGREYSLRNIERKLPKSDIITGDAGDESDAAAVFKKYEKKLPQWVRRELIAGKPTAGKRSEMIWKLQQTLIERGVALDDAFVLIKACPWNKFAGRRNEDEQLKRELSKSVNHHLNSRRARNDDDDNDDEEGSTVNLSFQSMDEVEEENIDWIYYPYLARSELSILEGDPGIGKSYLMQMIGAGIADGKRMPCMKKLAPVEGKVLFFDMENSAGSVTKKRLTTNNIVNLGNFIQCEEPFSIDDEDALEVVYDYVEKTKPVLVVFDTINTYLGKADAFKGHEVQQAFGRFSQIAKRFNCSVVVLRHLTKSGKERALYRGQGSIAFAGLARVVMTVGQMPEEPDTKVMAVTKLNVARFPKALTYTISALPDTLKDTDRSLFTWGEFVDLSADDILSTPAPDKGERKEGTEFLKSQLENGPVEAGKLERMAEARSVSRRTLHRAADELGVKKKTKGFGKERKSYWSLPDEDEDE